MSNHATTTPNRSHIVRAGRPAARSRTIERAGRVGHVAKGISYGAIGLLAVQVAIGQGGDTTDHQGVLRRVASESWGPFLLVVLATGFAAYALWRLAQALFDRGGDGTDAEGVVMRLRSLVSGVVYALLATAAVALLVGSGGGGGSEKEETARVLEWPGGRWIVLAVAVVLVGAGLYNVYRGGGRGFVDELHDERLSPRMRPWVVGLGAVGHVARGVVFALVGIFLGKAAVEYDPDEAVGIDGALRKLAEQDQGPWLLGLTAAGLIAYGVYCLVAARYQRM